MTLLDKFNRHIDLIQIVANHSCQYECSHCSKKSNENGKWLFPTENLLKFIKIMAALGLKRTRLIGGEPLLRPDIIELTHALADIKPEILTSVATNGKLLGEFAKGLSEARLNRLFVTLPSLDPKIFERLTGKNDLPEIMDNLDHALGFPTLPITIKMTVINGVNDKEIESVVEWALSRELDIYLVEAQEPGSSKISSEEQILGILKKRYRLTRMSGMAINNNPWKTEVSEAKIKIVTKNSRQDCHTCNRLWLSADGILTLCPHTPSRLNLNDFFENDPSTNQLADFAMKIALNKPIGAQNFGYAPL